MLSSLGLTVSGKAQQDLRWLDSGRWLAPRLITRFEPIAPFLRLTGWRIQDHCIRCRSPGIKGAAPGTKTGRGYNDLLASFHPRLDRSRGRWGVRASHACGRPGPAGL